MSDGYQCPECGGRMRSLAQLTCPPVYQAKCEYCGVVYQKRNQNPPLPPLPRDYERITPPEAKP